MYVTRTRIGQCANSKLMTDTGSHDTLRIHLMHSMPTFNTLSLFSIYYVALNCHYVYTEVAFLKFFWGVHHNHYMYDPKQACSIIPVTSTNMYIIVHLTNYL